MKQLSQKQKDLLYHFNTTDADFPAQICLPELFENQCKLTPLDIAVEFNGSKLSYQELNNKANKVAAYLQKHGAGPDQMVGLCVERSFDLVIGVLGILKSNQSCKS